MSSPSKVDVQPLDRLLHDVRTPLGVAYGYLRMIRDQRFADPVLKDKALAGVSQALAQVTQLCDVAAGRAPSGIDLAPRLTAKAFADALVARLAAFGVTCLVSAPIADDLELRTGESADAVLEAVTILVRSAASSGDACLVRTADDTLTLVLRSSSERDRALVTLPLEAARS